MQGVTAAATVGQKTHQAIISGILKNFPCHRAGSLVAGPVVLSLKIHGLQQVAKRNVGFLKHARE